MRMVQGTFNGTGAAAYICCGFIPDWVKVFALEDSNNATLWWSRGMRAAEVSNGLLGVLNTNWQTWEKTATTGIEPYEGGDELTSDNQTSVSYGEGIYLGWDHNDYKDKDIAAGAIPINKWTLDTAANRTGHVNTVATGAYIGEGSEIWIGGKRYLVEAWAAGYGTAANAVTLSRAAPSGTIDRVSGMYDLKPLPVGSVTPAGFKLALYTDVNVDGEMQMFEAGTYDN